MIQTFSLDAFLAVLVVGLCVYRVTRFIVVDTLIGEYPDARNPRGTGLRRRLDVFAFNEDGTDRSFLRGKLGELFGCPFCTGVWVAGFSWWGWNYGPDWLRYAMVIAAIAGVQAFIQSRPDA